jgi:hypothetical protein
VRSSRDLLGGGSPRLPGFLSLSDPSRRPILIAADAGAGKTGLLRAMAQAIEDLPDPANVRFAVVTDRIDEWRRFRLARHCDGVMAFHDSITTDYVHSVALCRPTSLASEYLIVLLIDGFEALASDGDLCNAARALLQSPPPPGILAIVTLDTSAGCLPLGWLAGFKLRILGCIGDTRSSPGLTSDFRLSRFDVLSGLKVNTPGKGDWLAFEHMDAME